MPSLEANVLTIYFIFFINPIIPVMTNGVPLKYHLKSSDNDSLEGFCQGFWGHVLDPTGTKLVSGGNVFLAGAGPGGGP